MKQEETGNIYGECDSCGAGLEPVWFTQEETVLDVYGCYRKTGRKRRAVDALVCPCCFKEFCVDDTFDSPWYRD